MRRIPLYTFMALLGSLVCASAYAEASPDWLARMAQAIHTQNYQGVMVYVQGNRADSMRIVHRYQNGREQERIQALGGDAREIHRDNDVVTCIMPRNHAVRVDRRGFRGILPSLTPDTIKDAAAQYEVIEIGSERMVDRDCRAVLVKPRDGYRYGYRIWVDEATAVPLKIELLGQKGEPLEQLMFTQIEYPASIADSALRSSIDASKFVWIKHESPGSGEHESSSNWIADHLPPGFQQVVAEKQNIPGVPEPIEHLMFSDGLTSVSAFVAPSGAPQAFKGVSRMGAVNAYGRMTGKYHVTVVGEVPQMTVEFIGDNLRHQSQPAATALTAPDER